MTEDPRKTASDPYRLQVSEVSDSIQSVFELSTRIDERVLAMMKKQEELERKMDVQLLSLQAVSQRVAILEAKAGDDTLTNQMMEVRKTTHDMEMKIQLLEGDTNRNTARWSNIFSFVVQIVWCVFAAYVLYKLGLQAPVSP